MNEILPTATLFKVKPDKIDVWRNWCAQLQTTHKSEALETLTEENVVCEFFITYTTNSDTFTLGVALTPDGSEPLEASTDRELNSKHKQTKRECLEFVEHVPFSYYLERFESQ